MPGLDDALRDHDCVVVLSPHPDDAALSCGSLLARISSRLPVTVMSLFTACHPDRASRAARAELRRANARRAPELYHRRRARDLAALRSIGVTGVHFGLPDALYRRRVSRAPRLAGALLPELDCVYPTFRLHASRGRISPHDRPLLEQLERRVLLATTPADLILAPFGLGGHVDHMLTHELGKALSRSRKVGWYADQPYVARSGVPVPAPAGAQRVEHEVDREAKASLIAWYGLSSLPADGPAPELEEYVYVPAAS
ncbi:PIG-L deacetylase family protein [Kineosporia succinea]|uniref:LmbE family N-acetylglucosaminyl deacetylase n=1 Tax=Kineosporia succinea TaxID=84632 RepID=A0ABT9P676_9ACTN|nr:PIG-L family deacetylase [Kineosporia succinea]MDP9828191.1 LmbE family N-acetylglucosaminyl deacetylase [Kineosporia succinea]